MVLPRDLESQENGVSFWADNGENLVFRSLEIHELNSIWDGSHAK